MDTQPVTQETVPLGQLVEFLDEASTKVTNRIESPDQEFVQILNDAAARSPKRTHKPIQMTAMVSEFEDDVAYGEYLIDVYLGSFVNRVRQAAQNDENARAFDDWADGLDLAVALEDYEKKVVPLYKMHAAILRKVVKGWNRRAKAGEIEPDLPPKLAKRVKKLDKRIDRLTRQITKREDNELIARLLIRVARHRPLSAAEKIRLSDAVRMKVKYKIEPSIYREDWYGDNAR